eukprot:Skav200323  [mRNA]  locus=scaffold1760:67411:71588:- [translate_table: standard]
MLEAEPAAQPPPPIKAGAKPAKPKPPKAPKAKAPQEAAPGTAPDASPKPPPKAKGKVAPAAPAAAVLQPPPPKEKQQPVLPKSGQQTPQKPKAPANIAPKPKQAETSAQPLAQALAKPPAKSVPKSEVLQPPKKQPPVKAPAKEQLSPKAKALEANQPKALAPKQPLPSNAGQIGQAQNQIHPPPKAFAKKAPGAAPGIQSAPAKAKVSEGPPKSEATGLEPPKAKAKQSDQLQVLPPKAKPAKAKVKAQPTPSALPVAVEAAAPALLAQEPDGLEASETSPPNGDKEAERVESSQPMDLSGDPAHDAQETPVGVEISQADEASNHEKQVREQIELDLPRTFPNTPEVDSQRASIRKVLLTYSRLNPHIGYCQGMSFPAAVLCANLSESAATERFQSCLEKVRELWLPGFHIFETVKQAFDALLAHQSQALAQSFKAQDVILDVFLLDAWLTMFARWLPFNMLFRALDFVETQGFSGVLSLTVAMVNSHGQSIVGVEKPDALLQLWKCLQWDVSPPPLDELLNDAKGECNTKNAAKSQSRMLPRAKELLAEQCTMPRSVDVALAFERRGPQILHVGTGADILDLLSQESWERWKAQAEKYRKVPLSDLSEKSDKDTKASKNTGGFLSIFRCGRARSLVCFSKVVAEISFGMFWESFFIII